MIKRTITAILALLLILTLLGCKAKDSKEGPEPENSNQPSENVDTSDDGNDEALQLPDEIHDEESAPEKEEYVYEYYKWDESQLVPYDGIVEHLFFHQVIAYPEMAFDGDAKEKGIDDYMVTVSEFNKILDSLYEKGYILVNWNDVWSEYTDENGVAHMKRNTLMIPDGRKPLVISIDDTNYYEYMLENGFTYKLILGDDGEIWSWGLDPEGNEVISQDLDIITIMDKFIKEHPDFTMNGVKGCLALTGYEGIFGYRTNTDTRSWTEADEAHRLTEVEAVKPIVEQLKKTGWYFGCHTWGHINLSLKSLEIVQADMNRWLNEVGTIVGETKLFIYPHGARPDGDDWQKTGPVFKYLQSMGFRVFASVGIESFSYIKKDISAVICDRLHADGTTLRWYRDKYLKFYDAAEVFDYDVRPDYGYNFGSNNAKSG